MQHQAHFTPFLDKVAMLRKGKALRIVVGD